MRKFPMLLTLALLGLGACDVDAPRSRSSSSTAVRAAEPKATASPNPGTPSATTRVGPVFVARAPSEPEPPAPLDPAGVLDDEERRLLEADDASLTRDERVARAHAQRKLVMADPEHPLRPVLERIETRVASGEYSTMAQSMWSGRAAFPDQDEDRASDPRP